MIKMKGKDSRRTYMNYKTSYRTIKPSILYVGYGNCHSQDLREFSLVFADAFL